MSFAGCQSLFRNGIHQTFARGTNEGERLRLGAVGRKVKGHVKKGVASFSGHIEGVELQQDGSRSSTGWSQREMESVHDLGYL